MLNLYYDAALAYWKIAADSAAVLGYRLPLLSRMASEPAAFWNVANWLEVNRMVSEKLLAYGEVNVVLLQNLLRARVDSVPTPEQLLRLQRRSLRPVQRTLNGNVARLRPRRKR